MASDAQRSWLLLSWTNIWLPWDKRDGETMTFAHLVFSVEEPGGIYERLETKVIHIIQSMQVFITGENCNSKNDNNDNNSKTKS